MITAGHLAFRHRGLSPHVANYPRWLGTQASSGLAGWVQPISSTANGSIMVAAFIETDGTAALYAWESGKPTVYRTVITNVGVGDLSHYAPAVIVDSSNYVHVWCGMHNSTTWKYWRGPLDSLPVVLTDCHTEFTTHSWISYPQPALHPDGSLWLTYRTRSASDTAGRTGLAIRRNGAWTQSVVFWEPTCECGGDGMSIDSSGVAHYAFGIKATHVNNGWNNVEGIGYAKSSDGVAWTTSDGTPYTLPIDNATVEVAASHGVGLWNAYGGLGVGGCQNQGSRPLFLGNDVHIYIAGTGRTIADLACADHTGPPFDVTSPSHAFASTDDGYTLTITAGGNWTGGSYVMTYVDDGTVRLTTDPTNGSNATAGSGSTQKVGTSYNIKLSGGVWSTTPITVTYASTSNYQVGSTLYIVYYNGEYYSTNGQTWSYRARTMSMPSVLAAGSWAKLDVIGAGHGRRQFLVGGDLIGSDRKVYLAEP